MDKIASKLLSIFCFILIFAEAMKAECDTKVQLNLKAHIDEQLNIERIDNNGDIDIFDRPETKYRVVSNLNNNVKVSIQTQNDWKLLPEDAKSHEKSAEKDKGSENAIAYHAEFKSSAQSVRLGRDNANTIIKEAEFADNCSEFSLVFCADDALNNHKAGSYGDKITISVTADK